MGREIAIDRFGDPRLVPNRALRPREVRIRQIAVGVNFIVVHGRRGDCAPLRAMPTRQANHWSSSGVASKHGVDYRGPNLDNARECTMKMQDQPVNHLVARASLGEGGRIVWDFLTLFAQRRYGDANAFLAPGCRMLFPGGVLMTDCLQVPQQASSIYLWVKKVFERFDEYEAADGIVVYNYGTLRGEWLDGKPFEGVRYIDRFLIRDGKIVDQQVWNDLCVAAAARARR